MLSTLPLPGRLALLFVLSISALGPLCGQDVGLWYYETPGGEAVKPRNDASLVRVGDYVYLLGGTGTTPIQRYDPEKKEWKTMGTTLDNLHHFQAQVYDNKIYIIGAFQGHYLYETPYKDILVYDPKSDQLQKVGSLPKGRERGSTGLILYDNKFYLFGGHIAGHNATTSDGKQAGPVAWVDRYDPKSGKWTQLPNAPHARDHFQAVVYNDAVYLAGGGRSRHNGPGGLYGDVETAVDVFNLKDEKWLTGKDTPDDLPVGATGAATALVDGSLVVAGGRTSGSRTARSATYVYDLKDETWSRGKSMIRGRQTAASVVLNKRMYVAAGSTGDNGTRIAEGDVYAEFFSKENEKIPTLDGWVTRTASQYPRAEGQMITYRGEFYHFNGFDYELKLQVHNQKYNPATDTWSPLAPHPRGLDGEEIAATHTGIALVGDVVWMAGGRIGSHPGRVTKEVYLYNITKDSWEVGPALPAAVGAGGLARVGRKLHWIGGFDELGQCNVEVHWVYDLDRPAAGWQDYSNSSPMPEARNHFGTVVLGGKIYTVGGQFDHDGCLKGKNTQLMHVYDPLTDTWKRLADLPDVQSHTEPSTFAYNKKIYSLGGQGGASAQVWEYTPEEDRWRVLNDLEMPLRLIAPGARVYNELLYVMIGGKIAVNVPQKDVWATYFGENKVHALGFYPKQVTLATEGQTSAEVILVNYSAEDEIEYSFSTKDHPDWLTVTGGTGTARESFEELQVTVNPRGLAKGEYSYTLKTQAKDYRDGELKIVFRVDENQEATDGEPSAPTPKPKPDPTPDPTPGELSVEGECGTIGAAWQQLAGAEASGGYYLSPVAGRNAKGAPPAASPENLVTYSLEVPTTGAYTFFVRASASGSLDDSFYFRLNGGPWMTWGNGLQSDGRFAWQIYPGAPFYLAAGTLHIDLAYRESGLKLDKLVFNTSGRVPSGLGTEVPNCAPPETEPEEPEPCAGSDCTTELWLEAECAAATGNWRSARDPLSGANYRVFTGASNYSETNIGMDGALSFNLNIQQTATYVTYFHLNAPTNSNNSFWVRVDESPWIKFWKETDRSNMLTDGFEWRRLSNDTRAVTLNLSAGSHTLVVANRESGTALDKIYLTTSNELPLGVGPRGANCGGASAQAAAMPIGQWEGQATRQGVEGTSQLSLFPNPVRNQLTVEVQTEGVMNEVSLRVLDLHGRSVQQRTQSADGTSFTTRIDLSMLPQGMYSLEIRAGAERLQRTFVKGL